MFENNGHGAILFYQAILINKIRGMKNRFNSSKMTEIITGLHEYITISDYQGIIDTQFCFIHINRIDSSMANRFIVFKTNLN
jgi:hypothetical protein